MTSTTEHPDAERLYAVAEEHRRQPGVSLLEALDGWIDRDTLLLLCVRHFRLVEENAKSRATSEELYQFGFVDAFLLGAQFQAAGGHREVPDGH